MAMSTVVACSLTRLNFLQQQAKFDDFVEIFNKECPHEALDKKFKTISGWSVLWIMIWDTPIMILVCSYRLRTRRPEIVTLSLAKIQNAFEMNGMLSRL